MQAPLASGFGVIHDESVGKENKFLTPRGLVWPFNHRKWRQVGYSHTQTHTMVLTSPSTCLISSLTNPQTHNVRQDLFVFCVEQLLSLSGWRAPEMWLYVQANAINTQTEKNWVYLRQNCSSGTIHIRRIIQQTPFCHSNCPLLRNSSFYWTSTFPPKIWNKMNCTRFFFYLCE